MTVAARHSTGLEMHHVGGSGCSMIPASASRQPKSPAGAKMILSSSTRLVMPAPNGAVSTVSMLALIMVTRQEKWNLYWQPVREVVAHANSGAAIGNAGPANIRTHHVATRPSPQESPLLLWDLQNAGAQASTTKLASARSLSQMRVLL